MDYDESSDILGGRLQVSPQRSSVWSDPGRITLLLGVGLAALYTWARLAPHYRQWKETRYRKAMRRRHGIPDDDNRPFNVAYAAALQAKKQREGCGRPLLQEDPSGRAEDGIADTAQPPSQALGKSGGYARGYPMFDRGLATSQALAGPRPDAFSQYSGPEQDHGPQPTQHSLQSGSATRNSRHSSVKQPVITRPLHGKHALDDESDSEPETQAKKTRVEREESIDGDEEPGWHGSEEEMDVDEVQPIKRGSKRVASAEDDEGLALSRADRLDKRARKVSIDKSASLPEQEMDRDEAEDGDDDSESLVRGKKRDRVEAGSTFGGDDSIVDDEEKPKRRRRKRKVSNKFEQNSSRGQKRGRDSPAQDSDISESEQPRQQSTRKKRGRRSNEEIIPVSNDPLCKGRRIGEEWESNGIMYKVGPNGQRLRQELVKKSRSKFPMPSDSQHPDRRAHVDVYVETWLSEEEYKVAKEHHELAWQDTPPTPPEPQTPGDVPDSPSKTGKNLLWASTVSSRDSPVKRGPFRQSVATNVGLRLNVFPPPPVTSTRRISSVYHSPASPATDSPKLQKTKSYSKWEKQDLEAAAMLKIRDRQQAAHSAEADRTLQAPTTAAGSTPNPPLYGATAATTAPTASKASDKPVVPSFSFAPTTAPSKLTMLEAPKIAIPSSIPAPTTVSNEPPKPSALPFFASPMDSTSSAAASTAPASAASSSATGQAGPSIPNFFTKSATEPATAAPSTTSVPDFFAKPGAQSSMPVSGTSSSATPVQASQASKSTFSFAPQAQQAGTSVSSPFGNATNDAQKSDQAKAAPGTSSLSRIGMGPPPAQSSAAPIFSFAKPQSAPSSAPAAGSADAAKAARNAPAPGNSAMPKFSFGVSSKPSGAAPSLAPTANGTSATGPTANFSSTSTSATAAASSPPKFSFGVTSGSSQPSVSSTANSFGGGIDNMDAPSAPESTFSLGGSSTHAPSPFGGLSMSTTSTSPFGAPSNNAAKLPEVHKSAFSIGANNGITPTSTTNTSPFGATAGSSTSPFGVSAAHSSSPFGTSTASSPFGAPAAASSSSPFGAPATGSSSSPFGVPAAGSSSSFFGPPSGNATKPAEAPKSAFSLGGNTSSTPSTTPSFFGNNAQSSAEQKTNAQTQKPTFSFSASSTPVFGAASTAGPAQGSKSNFFGTTSSNTAASTTTPPTGTTTNATENKPSFSFNFSSATNPGNGTAATSSAPSGSTFGFGSQPSNTLNAAAPAPSPFGSNTSNQQGSNTFGFGTSSGSFSFGSNSGQNAQK